MINRKFLVSAALAAVLACASPSYGQSGAEDFVEEADVFYAKVGYAPGMIQETEWSGSAYATTDKKAFKPKYDFGLMGGSGALGYYFGGMRVEIEGSVHKVAAEKDTKLSTTPVASVNTSTAAGSGNGGTGGAGSTASNANTVATYKGATFIGGMLSVNYDVAVTEYISPYFGVGFGAQRVALDFEKSNSVTAYHLASQLKAGVNVTGLASVVPYAGYKFTYLNEREYTGAKADDGTTTFAPKVAHMVHNFEVGVMVPMNA
ncbi:P44/Msp2 family outer membrane protein [Neorickettsia findlayensis]|uniref:P44/Msp2 family outer membrane protein n=2 Tax=Neorickettsia TaxID=33993 RepID=A0A6P1GCE2_9RICK|nr:P44/Msp2 family outer membrane protein [Neorickettsia findlayensis]AEK71069.1 surface protein 3 [Neorickettsia risticii]QHD65471.1 P44/Msp2 family outer membrane protein [Neorickettsia findlayensis]